MKKLVAGAVVAALCGVPVLSRAETASAPREAAAPAQREAQSCPKPDGAAQSSDCEASDYAAREKAAPQQLHEFAGGADGVYIGGGVLLAALIVVLLVTVL